VIEVPEITTAYHWALVVLSLTIAIFSVFVALTTVARFHDERVSRGRATIWAVAFGISLGAGIWMMHFVAMLALILPVPVHYDLNLTLLSLLVAIVFATLGALPIRRGGDLRGARLVIVGSVVGLGIAGMHFTGMAAMQMDASMRYDIPLLVLSVIIAVVASSVALWIANALRSVKVFADLGRKFSAALVMGIAVSAMHYTGMAAVHFYGYTGVDAAGFNSELLIVALSVVGLLGQGGVLIFAALDESVLAERLSQARLRQNEALKSLLSVLNDDLPVERRMALALDSILDHDWLGVQAKGAIFSLDGDRLVMISSRNMAELATICASVELGQCLCGEAARNQQVLVVDHIDERHELGSDNMAEHGHCVLPLRHSNQLLGVLNVYLPAGAQLQLGQRMFLESAAEVLAQALARERSSQENMRLEMAIEQVPDAIIIADREGVILYANSACMSSYGHGEPILGKLVYKLAACRQGHSFEPMLTAIQAGRAWSGELDLHVRDDEYTVRRLVSPVNGGKQFVFMDHDIADERKQQRRIEHLQRLDSLGMLAGGIAHDFNNILTAILGNAAMAERKVLARPDEAIRYLANIVKSSEKAAELCKQMLAYSGKGQFTVQPINLSAMVVEITKLLEISIRKNVVLKFHLSEQLPSVEADAAQLQQVIMNLVINASDAIADHSGVISISTGVAQVDRAYLLKASCQDALEEGRYVYLEVSDTGCGMDDVTQQHIFDPFYTTKATGHGLGMSAVLGILRGHRGTLMIYSEPGQGSSLKVLLPMSELPALPVKQKERKAASWQGTGTVLIVDDDETIREIASMMLEDMGFATLVAADGLEGIEEYRHHQHDIAAVLLDMTMPKLDGQGCYRELRRINRDVKVILSSGYNEQEATGRFTGKGLAGFIQKPYHPDALAQLMRSILPSQPHGRS